MNVDFRTAAQKLRPSIIGIGRRNDPELEIFGTGFVIHSSGWIMTNRHVLEPLIINRGGKVQVDGKAAAFLFVYNKPSAESWGAVGILGTRIHTITFGPQPTNEPDESLPIFRGLKPTQVLRPESVDIGLCKIEANDCPPEALPFLPVPIVESNFVTEGLPIAILGFPQGLRFPRKFSSIKMLQFTPLLQTGIIAGVLPSSGPFRPDAFLLDICVNPGSSGSPLFTSEGEVIGTVYATRQWFTPLIRCTGDNVVKTDDMGVYLLSALGLAVPSSRFPREGWIDTDVRTASIRTFQEIR